MILSGLGCGPKTVSQHRFWPGGLRSVVAGWCARDPAGRKGYLSRKQGPERLPRLRGTAALQVNSVDRSSSFIAQSSIHARCRNPCCETVSGLQPCYVKGKLLWSRILEGAGPSAPR